MLFMAVFHPGPRDFAGRFPALLMQHGPTPGVTVHGAWQGGALGTQKPSDNRRYVLFECEAERVEPFLGYMRPYFEAIEVRSVVDYYLSQYRAAEARDPELMQGGPNQTEQQRRTAIENARRYMAAATPAEAMNIWVEIQESGPQAMAERARKWAELA